MRDGVFDENFNDAIFVYGFNGQFGSLTLSNGNTFTMQGTFQGAFAEAGRDAGSEGLITVTGAGSRLNMNGAGNPDFPVGMNVGRNGGSGTLEVLDGGNFVMFEGAESIAYLRIGRGAGAEGVAEVSGSDSFIYLESGAGAQLQIGREGGTGTMTLADGGAVDLVGNGANNSTFVDVGVGSGSAGEFSMREESFLGITDNARDGFLLVGTEGATGNLTVDGSEILIVADRFGGLQVATRFPETENNTGEGSVRMENGALLTMDAGIDSNIFIGGSVGSAGIVEVLSGSRIDMGGNGVLRVGRAETGTTPGGDARLVIDGDGSILEGARSANIGHGTVEILSGGQLDMADWGAVNVGLTDLGSNGTLSIRGAGSLLSGARGLSLGAENASGSADVSDGAWLRLGHPDVDDWTWLEIGRHAGSVGEMTIASAFVSQQGANGLQPSGESWQPYAVIGRDGGTGTLEITGNRASDPDALHGYIQIGGADSEFSTIDIGRGADSQGSVSVTGAFFGTENRGSTYVAETGEIVDLPGDGGGSSLRVGVDGGVGSLTATAGAEIFSESGTAGNASFQVGARGTGESLFDASTLEVVTDGAGARLLVGFQGGGDGSLTLRNGSTATLDSGEGGTSFALIGFEGGTGHLRIADADTQLSLSGAETGALLAHDGNGGSARLDLVGGGHLDAGDFVIAGNADNDDGENWINLDGGSLSADSLNMWFGTLMGAGTLTDIDTGNGFASLNASELLVGDVMRDGVVRGQGDMVVTGDVEMSGSLLRFSKLDGGGPDRLLVDGALSVIEGTISVDWIGEPPGIEPAQYLLARATGGIDLQDTDMLTSLGPAAPVSFELRAGDTELWMLSGEGDPAEVSISGSILTRSGSGLEGVSVAFTPDTGATQTTQSAPDGAFSFSVPTGTSGTIDAALDYTPGGGTPAITTASALETLRMAVGLNPSWGPAEALDYVAADFNGDGQVTTADALGILRVAVGLADTSEPRWMFIDSEADLSAVGQTNTSVPQGLTIDAPGSDVTDLGLVGVLVGHVQHIV